MSNVSIVAMAKEREAESNKAKALFSEAELKLVHEFIKAFHRKDVACKEVFCLFLAKHKAGITNNDLVLLLGELMKNQHDEALKGLKEVNALALSASKNKVLIKMPIAAWYNIKASIKLFDTINEMRGDTVYNLVTKLVESKEVCLKNIRETLFDCYTKGISNKEYNDTIGKTIKVLRKTYGIIEVEGKSIVTNLEKQALKLEDEDFFKLYDVLTKDFKKRISSINKVA